MSEALRRGIRELLADPGALTESDRAALLELLAPDDLAAAGLMVEAAARLFGGGWRLSHAFDLEKALGKDSEAISLTHNAGGMQRNLVAFQLERALPCSGCDSCDIRKNLDRWSITQSCRDCGSWLHATGYGGCPTPSGSQP